jgi:gliding motility-associated-like protein
MRRLLLLLVLFLSFFGYRSYGQMVGGEIFLPGHWLEIGQTTYGAFGANPPPAGYNPYPAGSNLAETYDYGHDGWTVGAPPFMGDYTYPGSPFEGWGIQIGSPAGLNYAFCNAGISGTGTLTGNNISYVNAGGQLIGNWAGTAAGGQLSIKMETRVDTNASWVVVTAKLYNTGATTLNNIYYVRSCDPDNDEAHGGSFATYNQVTYQNLDPQHRVGVRATGETYTYAYLQLCTKDPRAKAFVYDSWPISATDLSTVYAGTAGIGQQFGVGVADDGDIAIGICYHICDICPHDSTFVSYAYTFLNTPVAIDSAFPEPTIVVNGVPIVTPPAPAALYDTFNSCLFPGLTVLPVNLTGAASGAWTWSTWNWAPGTGLSSTTGLVNNISLTALPPSITYTITGTAYAGCAGAACTDSATKVIYLTVLTCNGAIVNSPCYGDTLTFNVIDSTAGATYVWTGPAPYTTVVSTSQTFSIYPATYADTGKYYVTKTVGGITTVDSAYAYIHPKPVLNLSSNAPQCIGLLTTLTLSVNPATVGETFSWTGPAGFTSALQYPTRPGYNYADTGFYTVIGTTAYGCKDTASIDAGIVNPPNAPVISGITQYCYGTPFVPFTVTGSNIKWYATDTSFVVFTTTPPTVNTSIPGTYTFFATQTVGCESPKDSITVVVYPPVTPNFTFTVHPGCEQDTVYFTNTSTGATSYSWNFGDGTPAVTTTNPMHIFSTHAVQNVTLTAYFAICSNSITEHPNTSHDVTAAFTPVLDTICAGQNSTMVDGSSATYQGNPAPIASYLWDFGDGTTSTTPGTTPAPGHQYNTAGIYDVVLTVTDAIGCQSFTDHNVYVLSLTVHSWLDTTLCLRQPLPLDNYVTVYPGLSDLTSFSYFWSPSGNLSSDTAHIPYFTGFGTYSITLTAGLANTDFGACPTTQTMVIHSVLGKPVSHVTADATILYGNSYQLNADSEVYYWWKPDNGTLNDPNINDPIATPKVTTTYTVYGMDINGCVDSAFVTIHVDSSTHECIPSGFTPNGDGLNDIFRPVGVKFLNLIDFRIYNRWGQQVFYTNSPDAGWDGTFQGVPQDMGTYYYNIIVGHPGGAGDNTVYKGDVTLIR